MEVTYGSCAGLDVHKKSVTVCCLTPGEGESVHKEIRSFGTMTADLLCMMDWLGERRITHVAMESTSEYWKPVYNLLEGQFTLLVVNARHIKNVPGRKTDVKDAEWIAELLRHGLLRGSFVPQQGQRDLRDLTRQRTNLVQDRATAVNRLQKVLEWANIKLGSVATNVTGVSGRAMLEGILQGHLLPTQLAGLAKGRLRHKQVELAAALTGHVREHHRFMIAQALVQIDFLDEQIEQYNNEIERQLRELKSLGESQPPEPRPFELPSTELPSTLDTPSGEATLTWEEAVRLLDTIPGVGVRGAECILAEIGLDMSRFATAGHLASWSKLSPGNNESAGKRFSGRTGKGNRWLRTTLVQAAKAASRQKNSYLSALYHRLAARRGPNRATIAIARHILESIYHMLTRRQPYRDLGPTYYDEREKQRLVKNITRRLNKLGMTVVPLPEAACP